MEFFDRFFIFRSVSNFRFSLFSVASFESTMVFSKGVLNGALQLRQREEEEWLVLHRVMRPKQTRKKKWKYKRINWKKSLETMDYIGGFVARYRMTEDSFYKLVDILRPAISFDEKQSLRSTGGNSPITPEMIVAVGLRYLAGEKKISLSDIFGMSRHSVERVINRFLDAVDREPRLRTQLPSTPEELEKHSEQWDKLSGASGIYKGCVGAIDGYLAPKSILRELA